MHSAKQTWHIFKMLKVIIKFELWKLKEILVWLHLLLGLGFSVLTLSKNLKNEFDLTMLWKLSEANERLGCYLQLWLCQSAFHFTPIGLLSLFSFRKSLSFIFCFHSDSCSCLLCCQQFSLLSFIFIIAIGLPF